MTYSEKVKASKVLLDAIKALKDGEHVVVTYGTDYNRQPKRFRIRCMEYKSHALPNTYSIHSDDIWTIQGMNIDTFTKTTAKAFTFDLMGQRTTYNFPLYELVLVEEPYKEFAHSESFN